MITRTHTLSVARQCQILRLSRSTAYQRHPTHTIYPYLLRHLAATRPNHVWAADLTYIPMPRGVVYLVAGTPEIFNTDQGGQFTSLAFTGLLNDHGIRISMEGKGYWRDNVFVERLWKSIKHEEVYLRAYETVSAAYQGLERYLTFDNQTRPHRTLDGHTPDSVYFENLPTRHTAAHRQTMRSAT